ncbi:protease PrsW [Cytophagales bacterium WSM2-2]|nr:protease PrsW [Cytophagales bacterium WSM2-2]
MDKLLLLALALAPGAIIGLYIYLKDKYEREPIRLLVLSFFLGIMSTVVTLLISIPVNWLIPIDTKSLTEQAFHAFLLVALVEEFSKFIFVRWVLYPNKNFNEPFDGIVYAVSVSLGFAGLENILYVMNSGIETAIMRMFTAVPAHASFAVLMGYYMGRAKFEHGKSYLVWYGLFAATFFHGAYDYFWFISYVPGLWIGAIASLIACILFSRKAIHIHQQASPFIPTSGDLPKEENRD